MASNEEEKHDDVVAIELPAPAGWVKKFTPRKANTPQKNHIVFISPTGVEIKSKRQLEQYLKSISGGPAVSEFDWGTGTPRRSARLSGKSKAEASESDSPKKKQKTSGRKEKNNDDEADEDIDDKDPAAGEAKKSLEGSIEDAKNIGCTEVVEGAPPQKPHVEEVDKETNIEEGLEEPSAVEKQTIEYATQICEGPTAEVSISVVEVSKDVHTEVSDAKVDKAEEKSDGRNDAPDGKLEDDETCVAERNNFGEIQAAERPSETEPVEQEPNAGS